MDGGEKKEVRRPMNAFLIFCKRHRGFVREKNPDMDNRSVTRVLGDLWANLGEEKKIYTNLAKQYKDAFMKANPNYKWHSADKSQCSNKISSKPTNSRVIKNVAEIHTDGSIVPGKLADPDKMGGLNLLLMADKETCDSRNLSTSAAVFSLSRTPAASIISPLPVQTSVSSAEQQPSVSNSALLQLAEMCASELRGSSNDKPIPHRLAPLTLSIPPSSLPLLDSPKTSHHAMPPPKKRARHWSLTESDSSFETTNDNIGREYTLGNMFLQNASLQKMRCTSVGSAVWTEDKFALDRCPPLPSRRKLSSSATESIPSPSGPFTDDVDSPVFSPEMSFSGESKPENHECIDQTPRNISQWSEKFEKKFVPVSNIPVHHSPSDPEKKQQKLVKPRKQPQVTGSLQALSASTAVVSRSGMWAERKEQSISNEVPHTPRHGILPLNAAPSLGMYENREIDGRAERGYNADFYTWREPGKSKSKATETSPGSISPKPISISAADPSPLPLLRLNHDGDLLETKNKQQHSVARFGSAGNAKTTSSGLPDDFRSVSSSFSVVNEETSYSALSERTVASVINNLDSPTAKLKFSHNKSDSYYTITDVHGPNEFPGVANETHIYSKFVEQASPAHTTIAADGAKNSMLNLKDCSPKINEHGSLLTTLVPSTSQTQTFSEGKLKKKWAERMLIESRLNEDHTHQPSEVVKDPINNANCSQADTDANQNISPMESKPESSNEMNLIERPAVTSDSQISTKGRFCPSSAFNMSNQPLCSSEGTPNHPRSPKPQNNSIDSKLIPLSPQQSLKPSQSKPPTCSDAAKIKLEPDLDGLPVGQKLFHHLLHNSNLSYKKDVHCNQDLNNYGKQFMDHVVEQYFKSDFTGEKRQIETEVSRNCVAGDFTKKGSVTEVKSEPGYDLNLKLKEESTQSVRTCEKKDSCLMPAVSSTETVHVSTSQTEGLASGRKPDQEEIRARIPISENGNPASLPNHSPPSNVDESVKKLDTCKRAATSPSSDPCFQNQWLTVMPESCEPSDLTEDGGAQPLRKSRRPNRGQKYQELIKEGFIQPSRERLAARNADRHGRSFGTREEFEKMEMKRTLKRSVSERDTPSESPAVSCNSSSTDASAEKRFTSGDFDLEKEIESLPVCSLDQLDKKKMIRRRCDSDTLGSPPCLRNSGDTSSNSTRTSSQAKPSPQISSTLDLCEPGCPAPHIPLPKEDRPTEPITGSRKRKARKHCITRISVLEEKTSKTETSVAQTCVQPVPTTIPHKCLPGDIQRNSECDKISSDPHKPVPLVEMASHVKLDCSTVVGESRDLKTVSLDKMANVAADGNVSDKFSMSTFKTASSVKNGLISSSQILSPLSTVPPMKAASPLLSSNKFSESQLAFTAHKRKQESLLSPLPTIQPSTAPTITPKPASTAIILNASISKMPIKRDPILFKVDNNNTQNLVNKINSQQLHKQLVTLTAPKSKLPPLRVLPNEDLHKLKCLERKPKKVVAGFIPETSYQALQLPNSRSHYPVKKKSLEKQFSPVLSRSSNTPLVSALLGHSDLSSVIKLAERGDGRLVALKSSTSSEKSRNTRSPSTIRVDFPSPVLSALNTQFIPLGVGQAHSKTLLKESTSQEMSPKPALPSSNRASFSTPTTDTSPASSESSSLSDRLPFFSATSKSSTSHAFKPHHSTLLPTAPTSSFIHETVNAKLHQISMTVPPQLSLQHVSLVTQPCSSNTPDSYISKTYTSLPNTGAILHNSLINQHPPAAISSSSSSAICVNSAAFVSTASSLLTLIPPHSSSSSAVLPPTVISLAASVPSSKTDIVSYTVIGSSSVIDAGSPHMIGSPHLPESPSVAIVKS